MESSYSVENYIKGIYTISGEKKSWVNTNHLAEKMGIKPSSVTDMIKKLEAKKLVKYQKYKGVKLSADGSKLALKVIRKHRLWEVFLQQKLEFNWDEVHEIAEQLEHISSPELVRRLEKFLNFPKFDPHGDPIPDSEGRILKPQRILLSEMQVGERGEVVGVEDSSPEFLKFLEGKKLSLGARITILQKHAYDSSMDIAIGRQKTQINISRDVSLNLYITK